MLTAMQFAKIKACVTLQDAQRLIGECFSLVCMGKAERAALDAAMHELDAVVLQCAPTNEKFKC